MISFDSDLVARYARNNAYGFSLLTIAYLRDRDLSVADWARWLGREFASPETNWQPGMGAERMAREAALEMISCKAELLEISGDDESSEVRIVWPTDNDLAELRMRRADVQDFWLVWEPIAASVGLRSGSSTDDTGVTTIRFAKATSSQ